MPSFSSQDQPITNFLVAGPPSGAGPPGPPGGKTKKKKKFRAKGGGGGGDLLAAIRGGAKLKKTVTVDKSKPAVDAQKAGASKPVSALLV